MDIGEKLERIRSVAAGIKAAVAETSVHLSDATASGLPADVFPSWEDLIGQSLGNNVIVLCDGKLYRTMQALTVQGQYRPGLGMESLYKEITFSAEGDGIADWSQPLGATDAYSIGDRVRHNGTVWTSTANGNVWEPGVYGWSSE
jgi:hypothetical protein